MEKKSSIEWAELAGLKLAINNVKPDINKDVVEWMKKRIKELEDK
jgi:hypothetical protein